MLTERRQLCYTCLISLSDTFHTYCYRQQDQVKYGDKNRIVSDCRCVYSIQFVSMKISNDKYCQVVFPFMTMDQSMLQNSPNGNFILVSNISPDDVNFHDKVETLLWLNV